MVFDKDIGQDKQLGIVKFPLNDLEPETEKEFELRLLSSLDTLKVKDKKDRGTITIKIFYHQFNKEEQLVALEAEKNILEERKKLKEEGVIGTTMDALDGAASAVGSGVGMVGTGVATSAGLVGTGIGAGAGLVGTGIGAGAGLVGIGIGAGASLVGSGIGAGVGFVSSGLGAVGSGLSRAGKFMGRTIIGQESQLATKTIQTKEEADANRSEASDDHELEWELLRTRTRTPTRTQTRTPTRTGTGANSNSNTNRNGSFRRTNNLSDEEEMEKEFWLLNAWREKGFSGF
ncbi:hypothetical protein JHK85_048669 [Glycine max]|nr:hypothetical protein JHK85_048669 [Glycine max]